MNMFVVASIQIKQITVNTDKQIAYCNINGNMNIYKLHKLKGNRFLH